ncbi:Oxidase ustYa [Colletotrichum siamense]|nr:Oxidase ustYa [Colletotrichum siamense]
MASWLDSHQYSKIAQEETQGQHHERHWVKRYWDRGKVHIIYTLLLVFVAVVSNNASRLNSGSALYGEEPLRGEMRLKTAPRTFLLDLNYAMPPSPKVDKAWSSLLPERGGFFIHPKIAPKESCLAVFHQIHCLDMLRRALYETRPDIMNQGENKSSTASSNHGKRDKTTEINEAHDMYHLGHCFDLLRQAIMCKPDLTIEIANTTLNGVTGFGTEHQCINWEELMNWIKVFE